MRAVVEKALSNGPTRDSDALEATFEYCFAADEPVFEGHFPGHPLLPGIFQIEMTRLAAERLMGRPLSIARILKTKFTRAILPEETIGLNLRCTEGESAIKARARLSVGEERAGETLLELVERP